MRRTYGDGVTVRIQIYEIFVCPTILRQSSILYQLHRSMNHEMPDILDSDRYRRA